MLNYFFLGSVLLQKSATIAFTNTQSFGFVCLEICRHWPTLRLILP